MLTNLAQYTADGFPLAVIGAGIAWVWNAWRQAKKESVESAAGNASLTLKITEHRDNLTFELLNAAKEEVKGLREELHNYRQLERRVAHFEEALRLLSDLLHADDITRPFVETQVRAFLTRIQTPSRDA